MPDAEWKSEEPGGESGRDREQQRSLRSRPEQWAYGGAISERVTEIAVERTNRPIGVTGWKWPVEALLRAEAPHGLGGYSRIHLHLRVKVARRETRKGEREKRDGGKKEEAVGSAAQEISHTPSRRLKRR